MQAAPPCDTPSSGKRLQVRRLDDGFEIGDLRRVREIVDFPVGQAAAPRIETDQLPAGGQKRNQCRHTGLCQSNSRCDNQFADFTSGGPAPDVATARRTPSDLMKRMVCCMPSLGYSQQATGDSQSQVAFEECANCPEAKRVLTVACRQQPKAARHTALSAVHGGSPSTMQWMLRRVRGSRRHPSARLVGGRDDALRLCMQFSAQRPSG